MVIDVMCFSFPYFWCAQNVRLAVKALDVCQQTNTNTLKTMVNYYYMNRYL